MATTPPKSNPAPQAAATPKYTSPLAAKERSSGSTIVPRGNQTFLFDKDNYMWMIIGIVCILIGFFLMAGGKSQDPHVFNAAEVFSTRRITIAPMVILIGFGIEAYAIMKKPKGLKTDATVTV